MRPIDGDKLYADLREAGMVFALRMVAAAPTITPPPNDPLTPEQLLELEVEPVWLGGDGLNRWDIFIGVSTDGIACFLRAALPMDSCGRTWFPFRRRPEASANAE